MTDSSLWLRRAGAVLLAVGALAACATSTTGHPTGLTSTGNPTVPVPTGTGAPSGFPNDVHSLAALVSEALQSTTSVHLVLKINSRAAGPVTQQQTISGEGDETVENGLAKDSQLILTFPQVGTERVVTVDGKSYVMLPPSQRTSSKPWAFVTKHSSNSAVRYLANALNSSGAFAGTDLAKTFLSASDRLTKEGTTQLDDGTQVVRYALDVLTSRLPNSYPTKKLFALVGVKKVPTDLAIDAMGHIRQMRQHLSLTVHQFKVTTNTEIEMSDYNAPVSISAPPPDQVAMH